MSNPDVEIKPLAASVGFSPTELTVSLADGRRISVPLAWFPRLLNATDADRAAFHLLEKGERIHWPRLDEHICVASLLGERRCDHIPDVDPRIDSVIEHFRRFVDRERIRENLAKTPEDRLRALQRRLDAGEKAPDS